MLEKPGLTIWFTSTLCATELSGRSTSSTNAIHSNVEPSSRNKVCGVWVETRLTTRPMNAGIIVSSTAIRPPNTNSEIVRPVTWRM